MQILTRLNWAQEKTNAKKFMTLPSPSYHNFIVSIIQLTTHAEWAPPLKMQHDKIDANGPWGQKFETLTMSSPAVAHMSRLSSSKSGSIPPLPAALATKEECAVRLANPPSCCDAPAAARVAQMLLLLEDAAQGARPASESVVAIAAISLQFG